MKISKLIELSNQKRVAEEYAKSSEWNDDVRIYAIERIFEKPILFDIIEILRYIWENPDEVILIWPYYIAFVFALFIFIISLFR